MSTLRLQTLGFLQAVLTLAAVLAAPAFLTSLSLRVVINSSSFYEYGFAKYGVSAPTGMETAELSRVAREMISYFNSPAELYQTTVTSFGERRSLFNEREVVHLKDVKGLIRGVYWASEASLAVLLAFAAFCLARERRQAGRAILRAALWGSLLTLVSLTLLGLASLFAFPWLFYQFHVVSFSNLFWQLDPARDYLIRLFPQGFFYEATLIAFGATLAGALLVGGGSWFYLRLGRARAKKEPQGLPGAQIS